MDGFFAPMFYFGQRSAIPLPVRGDHLFNRQLTESSNDFSSIFTNQWFATGQPDFFNTLFYKYFCQPDNLIGLHQPGGRSEVVVFLRHTVKAAEVAVIS